VCELFMGAINWKSYPRHSPSTLSLAGPFVQAIAATTTVSAT
jgi:hypothetical protein